MKVAHKISMHVVPLQVFLAVEAWALVVVLQKHLARPQRSLPKKQLHHQGKDYDGQF